MYTSHLNINQRLVSALSPFLLCPLNVGNMKVSLAFLSLSSFRVTLQPRGSACLVVIRDHTSLRCEKLPL